MLEHLTQGKVITVSSFTVCFSLLLGCNIVFILMQLNGGMRFFNFDGKAILVSARDQLPDQSKLFSNLTLNLEVTLLKKVSFESFLETCI